MHAHIQKSSWLHPYCASCNPGPISSGSSQEQVKMVDLRPLSAVWLEAWNVVGKRLLLVCVCRHFGICLCVCACVCRCACVYPCARVYACVHVGVCTCVFVCVHVSACVRVFLTIMMTLYELPLRKMRFEQTLNTFFTAKLLFSKENVNVQGR